MPIEVLMLKDRPEALRICPACGKAFRAFLRGQIQRLSWFGLRKRYCALICWECKEIVGWEAP